MTASPVRRGVPVGVAAAIAMAGRPATPAAPLVAALAAALVVAASLAPPAWGQSATETAEPVQLTPAPEAQPDPAPDEQPSEQPSQQPAQGSEAAGGSADAEAPDQAAPDQGAPGEAGTAPAAGTSGTTPQSDPAEAAATEAPAGEDYVLGDIALGDPEAPLTVYEYASFTCPHCASFHEDTFPEFREKYIDTGKVRFVLREVYFDQYGLWASMVARCGGEQGFYPLVDAFLGSQSSWTRSPDIGHAIQQVGRRAGLSAARLEQCLSDRDFAKVLLEAYQENREVDEIQSTPTFVINGEKHTGAMSFEDFSAIVDAAL